MAPSTSSALSRHHPAVLFLTGISAACAAWLIYTTIHSTPSSTLHRSNAIRRQRARNRPNRASSHTTAVAQHLEHLRQIPLPNSAPTTFFGTEITLDPANLVPPDRLRETVLAARPESNPERLEAAIDQFYDDFLDRILNHLHPHSAPGRAEADALRTHLEELGIPHLAAVRAVVRHNQSFPEQVDGAQDTDGRVTPAATEDSWHTAGNFGGQSAAHGDGQTLRRTLYHIAEDRARQEGVIHRGVSCDACDAKPIRGIRWRCANCVDFDLCSECEATNSHPKTHIFYKVKVPAPYLGLPKQPAVYPGRPHLMPASIDTSLRKRLVSETKKSSEEIDALWDQFTCLAGTEWKEDPNEIGYALDRRSFNQAFIPRYSTFTSAPNLIYDRIFVHYDANNDGLIGFEEFVKGLDGMHSRDQKLKLRIVFNGYDIDGDGYISRKDVLRIFRAYYAIEKEATRNYIADGTDELSVAGALDTIRSGQPLGSAFTQRHIASPQPHRRLDEKTVDRYGDRRGNRVVRDDTEDVAGRDDVIALTEVMTERPDLDLIDPVTGEHRAPPAPVRDELVRERWNRRQFYVDEEEGLERPEGYEDDQIEPEEDDAHEVPVRTPETEEEIHQTGSARLARASRSSSRVRFDDDVDIETRSNASTSSRPVGERWGGYEVPEPEKDLGKEVLYQITQQAFNELLDPLFRDKEDLAMDAVASRAERRTYTEQISHVATDFKLEESWNRSVTYLGPYRYMRLFIGQLLSDVEGYKIAFKSLKEGSCSHQEAKGEIMNLLVAPAERALIVPKDYQPPADFRPSLLELWNTHLIRVQLFHEVTLELLRLLEEAGWIPSEETEEEPFEEASAQDTSESPFSSSTEAPIRDPTMPQFRPNTLADIPPPILINEPSEPRSPSESEPSYDGALEDPFITDDFDESVPTRKRHPRLTHYPLNFFAEDSVLASELQDDSNPFNLSRPATPILIETNADPVAALSLQTLQTQQPNSAVPSRSPSPRSKKDRPQPLKDVRPTRVSFILYPDEMKLDCFTRHLPVSTSVGFDPAHHIRIRASEQGPENPCYIPRLASLESVEREINERKGSGMLSFEEFERVVGRENKLRFLEVWMDWISSRASLEKERKRRIVGLEQVGEVESNTTSSEETVRPPIERRRILRLRIDSSALHQLLAQRVERMLDQ